MQKLNKAEHLKCYFLLSSLSMVARCTYCYFNVELTIGMGNCCVNGIDINVTDPNSSNA